ncbi:UNVERIFIED_CONTAM: MLO-like protein 5 [Sesamum radiatum]|uniref:MLO-like protein 5 n=1 Tax=Sesamum radiatum TaxID=300843 RepID=A0AAW2QFZ7_SESRA
MGGGGGGLGASRQLDQTPTWAVALVCAIIVLISVILEKTIHKVGEIRAWKEWEQAIAAEEESANDPTRFRLTHETSFVKGHNGPWVTNAALFYIASFFRHMLCAVSKADYFALRHGFISVHLAPGKKFDFQKYIKRSLEDDFKVIVGIPMASYVLAVDNAPSVGTKLQSIITRMAIEIQERHAVVQGIPLVQLSDRHFWFNRPKFVLHLLHITLFQNAFEITYFIWTTYEFGLYSCFHDYFTLTLIRVCIGVFVQFFCSYITLPLYALVSQMGSHMKKSIFDEQTSRALMNWHRKVKKRSESSCKPHSYRLGSSISLTNIISSRHRDSSVTPAPRKETGDGSTKVDILPESTAPAPADDNQPGKSDLSYMP